VESIVTKENGQIFIFIIWETAQLDYSLCFVSCIFCGYSTDPYRVLFFYEQRRAAFIGQFPQVLDATGGVEYFYLFGWNSFDYYCFVLGIGLSGRFYP
jgi:hypothetical protein